MPALIALIGRVLVMVFSTRIGLFIVSALASVGLSYGTYKFAVTPFRNMIQTELGGAGPLVAWVGAFGIDQAITIILSAIAAKYAVGAAKVALFKKAS